MPVKGKDGYYHSKVTPAKGVKPVYFRARTLREFNQKRQQIIEDYKTGRAGRDLPFVDLAREYFHIVREPRLRPSSAGVQRSKLNVHILQYFPPQQLARAIRYKDLQGCVDQMQGMSAHTVSSVIGLLKCICRYGVAEGAMEADYSTALRMPPVPRPAPRMALTAAQAAALRNAWKPEPVHIVLALQYYCGLRAGEALGLQWGDLDFKAGRLHVIRQYENHTRVITEPKTPNSTRWVDMPDELVRLLLPLRALPALFVATSDSLPMTYDVYRYRFVQLLLSLGMAHRNDSYFRAQAKAEKKEKPFNFSFSPSYYDCDFTSHNLRHNYATALFRNQVDPAMAMSLLGHTSYNTTLSVYTDIKNMMDDSVSLDDYLPSVLKKVAQKLQTRRTGTFITP